MGRHDRRRAQQEQARHARQGRRGQGRCRASAPTTRQQAGYPLNAYLAVPYTWSDANGDGFIGVNEVDRQQRRTRRSWARRIPRDQLTIQSGFDLFCAASCASTCSLDNKGGGVIFNQYNFLCMQTATCHAKSNPNAPTSGSGAQRRGQQRHDNARVRSRRPERSTRRTSATTRTASSGASVSCRRRCTLPEHVRRSDIARAQNASLTLGVRNLHVWTKYTGEDPESNYGRATCRARC